ncbi:MAG: hypothetical protein WD598_13015 [Acidimicrobiia bacterium]
MRHRTARTAAIWITAFVCIAGGTAIGVGMRRQAADDPSTALVEGPTTVASGDTPAAPGVEAPSGAAGTDPAADGQQEPAAPADDDANEGDDREDGDEAGEQAPPEGEERPPPRRNQPPIPELELEPGRIDPPRFLPPAGNGNGNGNGNQPPPPPPPPPPPAPMALRIEVPRGRIGPGPIYEHGAGVCNNADHSGMTSTWVSVVVSQQPQATPYRVTATARAGNATVQATVLQEPGQSNRFTIHYSFPRGSVRRPTNIAINATVTDARGRRATMEQWGGRDGIGHRLNPADWCP